MDFLNEQVQYLGLIFARTMALFSVAPIFAGEAIPVRTRIFLAFFIAMVLYPNTVHDLQVIPENLGSYMLLLLGHAMIGIIIGLMIIILFAAFQMSGDIFAMQMGLSFSEVVDPQSNISTPIIGILKNTIATLLFLLIPFQMDGFYLPAFLHLIRVLAYSFSAIQLFTLSEATQQGVMLYLTDMVAVMFITALKIGIPMVGILFISSLTLGIFGKAAPQMNLMSMGIQANIILGIFVILFLLPVLIPLMQESFYILYDKMGTMFHEWQ